MAAAEAPMVFGYPAATPRQRAARVRELYRLGVRSVSLTGPTELGGECVLGKGYVGVVVLARDSAGRILAIKIRRTDASRPDMSREAALLGAANAVGVGPKLYAHSRNFLAMQYVQGQRMADWLAGLSGRGTASQTRKAIRSILCDCRRLDGAGIDHGEISNITKHVIIPAGTEGADCRPVLIDFEAASTERRPSNVTSITQSIFISSPIAKRVQRILRGSLPPKDELVARLREYKQGRGDQSFERLLESLRL